MLTPDGLANDIGGILGPHERRGVMVPLLDVETDMLDERPDGIEGATSDRLTSQDPKPRFDQVSALTTFPPWFLKTYPPPASPA